jgi:hypothetical protein
MSASPDLAVAVQGLDIIVTMPGTGFGVTYRKEKDLPLLMSTDPMRVDPDPPRLKFLAQAWKAAHNKARDLGWLNS